MPHTQKASMGGIKNKAILAGALSLAAPGFDNIAQPEPPRTRLLARNREHEVTEAERYYQHQIDQFNPRFSQYEEKNPVILVIERKTGNHNAEVIRVIESAYGSENPPRIVYINSNLLDEDASFTLAQKLKEKGVSMGSVRAINYSMGAWSDSSRPSSSLSMRNNIHNFENALFVHAAGNMGGGYATFGLTTQSDHCVVVGATEQARHERPLHDIKETDFSGGTQTATSSVDMVMKGRAVPIDGISGKYSEDGKDHHDERKLDGTSFATPQVTAGGAKVNARLRNMYLNGLPGHAYPDEHTLESMHARDERANSFMDSATLALVASGQAINPGDEKALMLADGRPFDSKGSGYGMPHFGLAERILFDQMLDTQLNNRAIASENYQAVAPESDRVFPRPAYDNAKQEHAAMHHDLYRHLVPVRVPLPLKTMPIKGEPDSVAVELPAFDHNITTHLGRGTVFFERKQPAKDEEAKEVRYDLFIESPDGKMRVPVSRFSPSGKEFLWHTDRPHGMDDYCMVNFRTRAFMGLDSLPEKGKGWRLIIKAEGQKAEDIKPFASGSRLLPVLELTGVEKGKGIFSHHPAAASRLGFLSRQAVLDTHMASLEKLEDTLDSQKFAQRLVERFIEKERIAPAEIVKAAPALFAAAKGDKALEELAGLMVHQLYVEPIARGTAERLMHLAHHYETSKHDDLPKATQAYSELYKQILAYDKALATGQTAGLDKMTQDLASTVKAQAGLLAEYGRMSSRIYKQPELCETERRTVMDMYAEITGERLVLPAAKAPAGRAAGAGR
jgi:hypothetical protein